MLKTILSAIKVDQLSKVSSKIIEGKIIQKRILILPAVRKLNATPRINNIGKIITPETNQQGKLLIFIFLLYQIYQIQKAHKIGLSETSSP